MLYTQVLFLACTFAGNLAFVLPSSAVTFFGFTSNLATEFGSYQNMSNSTEAQTATRSRARHQYGARSVCSFVEPSNIQHSALETVMTPSGGDFIFFTWQQLGNNGPAPNENRLPIGCPKRPKHVLQHRGPPQYRLQVNMLVGCAAAQLACSLPLMCT